MEKTQRKIKIHNKIVYKVEQGTNWSIVIMPDNLIIDNYRRKGGNIHPNPIKHEEEIKTKNDTIAYNFKVVHNHIYINTGVFIEKLIKELIE
jgi:hypothetical protein